MDGCAGDGLRELDGVADHEVVGDSPLDVCGSPMSAPLGRKHAKAHAQRVDVRGPGARVRAAGVKEDERVAGAVLGVPGVDLTESDPMFHRVPFCRR